ncbi:hypothetical protein H2203_003992 [Taxawa tesnikishii (nom. ined.)]|nr:hypothetical protein H2203_003992 [Dothideales sp. JES 119]
MQFSLSAFFVTLLAASVSAQVTQISDGQIQAPTYAAGNGTTALATATAASTGVGAAATASSTAPIDNANAAGRAMGSSALGLVVAGGLAFVL